jgi:PAS domain S-box-containing protein
MIQLKKLKDPQLLFEKLAHASSDAIIFFNNELTILFANQSFSDLTGISINHLEGVAAENLFTGEEVQVIEWMSRTLNGESISIPLSELTLKRTKTKFSIQSIPFNGDDQLPLGLIILSPIEQADYMELKLFEENDFTKQIESLSGIGSWESDISSNYDYWSEEMYHIFEIAPHIHIYHDDFLTYVHPFDLLKVKDAFKQAIEEKKRIEFNYRIITPNDKTKFLKSVVKPFKSQHGKVEKLIGYSRDITGTTEMEKLLRSVVEQSIEGIMILKPVRDDSNTIIDFAIVLINKYGKNILSNDEKEIEGLFSVQFPYLVKEGFLNHFKKVITSTDPISNQHNLDIDGYNKWLNYSIRKINDHCSFSFQDISSTVKLADEINNRDSMLLFTEKASECGSFQINYFSNEFNYTPQLIDLLEIQTPSYLSFQDLILNLKNEEVKTAFEHWIEESTVKDLKMDINFPTQSSKFLRIEAKKQFSKEGRLEKIEGCVVDVSKTVLLNQRLQKTFSDLSERVEKYQDLEKMIEEKNDEADRILERFNLLSKASKDIMWDWNLETYDLWFNKSFQELLGYPEIQLSKGYEFWKLHIHPEDKERVVQTIENTVKQGLNYWQDEYRFLKADHTYGFIIDRGLIIREKNSNKPIRMIGTMMEIGNIDHLNSRLKESEETYREIAEFMPQLVWINDSLGNRIYSNQKWVEYTGLDYEEYNGQKWLNALFPDDISGYKINMEKSLMTGEDFKHLFRLRSALGEYRWFLARAIPIKDSLGNIRKWLGTSTDIHEQKEFSDSIEEAQQKLDQFVQELNKRNVQLDKMNKNLDNFVFAASHDLRSPIRNIETLLQFLNDEVVDQSKKEKYNYLYSLLLKSIGTLKSTINDLTEVTKLEIGDNSNDEVSEVVLLIEDIQVNLSDQIKNSNATIFTRIRENKIKFSRKNLRSILYNLVSNSIKYRYPDRLPIIEISTERTDEGFVLLQVKDNGIGLSNEDLQKIFKPFRRINENVEGSGVGLSIVQRIIDLNGGKIEVESEVGQGSIFKVWIKQA